MKCHQCERPALFKTEVGNSAVYLCLICQSTYNKMLGLNFIKLASMYNNALDQMDYISGIPTPGGRIDFRPIAKALEGSPVLNNIIVHKSQIGVLNTGSIEKIDAVITQSKGTDVEEISNHIRRFAQAVIDYENLAPAKKNDVLDLTETLSEQIAGPRRMATVTSVMKSIREQVQGTAALAGAADALWEVIKTTLAG